jgi:hypothetical protein
VKTKAFLKIEKILVVGLALALLSSCFTNDVKWKNVTYNNNVEFRVPEDWITSETEDGLIFSDRPLNEIDCLIYMVEIKVLTSQENNLVFESNTLGNGQIGDRIEGGINSLGVLYRKESVSIGDKTYVYRRLEYNFDYLSDSKGYVAFYIVSDKISKSTVTKIASSFTKLD